MPAEPVTTRFTAPSTSFASAFPAISTGVYRYPLEAATAIAVREVRAFLAANAVPARVVFVCFGARVRAAYEAALGGFAADEHR